VIIRLLYPRITPQEAATAVVPHGTNSTVAGRPATSSTDETR
jgi:hypothetical protein